MAARVCLVHYHEVGLKGKNRAHFEHILSLIHILQLLDYIHLNPVKGALDSLDAYRWSSYKAYQLGYDLSLIHI